MLRVFFLNRSKQFQDKVLKKHLKFSKKYQQIMREMMKIMEQYKKKGGTQFKRRLKRLTKQ
jgi:hypothetical protein